MITSSINLSNTSAALDNCVRDQEADLGWVQGKDYMDL